MTMRPTIASPRWILALGGLGLGAAALTTSCLRLNEEHCVLNGGDGGCGSGSCVVPIGGVSDAITDADANGCIAELPADDPTWARVEYGLPSSQVRTGDGPSGADSVESVVRDAVERGGGVFDGSDGCYAAIDAFGENEDFDKLRRVRAELEANDDKAVRAKKFAEELVKAEVEACMDAFGGLVDACTEGGVTMTGSSTGGETDTETGTSGSDGSTTGSDPCVDNGDCTDASAPFCDPGSGECVGCSGTMEPDGACAELDPMAPLCVEGECVACTAEDTAVCDQQMLLCDGETNECVPCTEHAQCGSGACELAVGRCFPADFVVAVDGDGGADYTSVAAAVADVGDGMYGVIIVHERDGDAPYTTPTGLAVDGGKTVAILSGAGEAPIILGTAGNPGLRVAAAGTAVYIDGVDIVGNTGGLGLEVDEAFAWVDRSRIVQNSGGGILAQNGANLTVRNSFVGDGTYGANAISVDGTVLMSSVQVLYTSLGSGTDNFDDVFPMFCDGTVNVSIRNSLLVSFDNAVELSCASANVTYSASESLVPGDGNVGLGDVGMDWFLNIDGGDFHLNNHPGALSTVGRWQAGDPTTDIDGDPRPASDGAMDYAGADVP